MRKEERKNEEGMNYRVYKIIRPYLVDSVHEGYIALLGST